MRDTLRHGMFGLLSLSMPTMCYPCLRTPVTHVSGLNIKPGDDGWWLCNSGAHIKHTAPQCFVTTLHFVTTASLICPASCAQATSSTLTEISLPMKPFSCAACASLEVM